LRVKVGKDYNTMSKSEQALSLFINGYNCAQSVLIAFASEAEIDTNMAFIIASGLGGGVGQSQSICGAINAGAIVLGMKFGRYEYTDMSAKDNVTKLVGKFVSECRKELGSTNCFELLKINTNDAVKKKEAANSNPLSNVCNNAVSKSAEILEKFLAENILPPTETHSL